MFGTVVGFFVCAACGFSVEGSSDPSASSPATNDGSAVADDSGGRKNTSSSSSSSSGGGEGGVGDSGDGSSPAAQGALKVTATAHVGNVNLSVDGQKDWAFWPAAPVERKRNVALPRGIDSFTELLGRVMTCSTGSTSTFTWNDGAPTQNQTVMRSDICGYQADTADVLFRFPALPSMKQILTLYLGGSFATVSFEARLSDSSAAPVIDGSQTNTAGNFSSRFVVEFASATPGATLDIHWKLLSRIGAGFITIKAATLN